MRNSVLRISYLLVGIILLIALIFVTSGVFVTGFQAQAGASQETDPGGGNVSTSTISLMAGTETQAWTTERMLAAEPYLLENTASTQDFTLQLNQAVGEPGFIPGSPPAGTQTTLSVQPEKLSNAQTAASGYSYPAPFIQYQNFDSYQVYPYSTVGVLFFRQYGVDYRCSAASIGNRAIWTAGHCIHKGDNSTQGWSSNVVFAPAWKDGSAPFGVWSVYHITTKENWFKYGDLRYDMGGALLNDYGGQTISEMVGSLGFAYNQGSSLHWMNFGYPSAAPFNGKTQQICAASYAYADTSMPPPSPVAMGCNMTPGSSGGPWILSFSGKYGGTNYLNGNNSYRYSFHPNELFSPYFGDGAKVLYDELVSGIVN